MGSAGTGNFTDYPGSQGGKPQGKKGGGGGGGQTPDDSGCDSPLEDIDLEEVASSEYVTDHKTVPPLKTKVRVRQQLSSGRIVVETVSSSESVGYLPTAHNRVVRCMKNGWKYAGTVIDSSSKKLPKVRVTLTGTNE
jgi:hypothetical protein